MRTIAITLLLLLSQVKVISQTLSRAEASEDLTILQQSIKQFNPALPHYHPEFDRLSNLVIQSVKDHQTIFEYFTLVSKICALSNEGHFALGNWEDVVHKGIINNTHAYLPLAVIIAQGQLYVKNDYSNEQVLLSGDQVLSINNQPADQILSQLIDVMPSDGHIKTYALDNIESYFQWLYLFHVEQAETFRISYVHANKEIKTVKISALIRSDQVRNAKAQSSGRLQNDAKALDGFYDLQIEEAYAILTLPSFDYRRVQKYEVKSKKMYETIFKELDEQMVSQLIIDLRGNTGGRTEFADDMVPYFLNPENSDEFLKKSVSWKGKQKTYKMPRASKYSFKGNIYVLTDGLTFSSGSSLARYLKEYANAIIIGEESGTRYEGFAAGSKQYVILPHSELSIGIPRYHTLYPPARKQETTNRGVMPDHKISYSIDAILNSEDLHVEKATSLMNQQEE